LRKSTTVLPRHKRGKRRPSKGKSRPASHRGVKRGEKKPGRKIGDKKRFPHSLGKNEKFFKERGVKGRF